MTQRGERVLQRATAAAVHVHVAGGHQREGCRARQRAQAGEAGGVVRAAEQFHAEPGAAGKTRAKPARVVGAGTRVRQPQGEAVRHRGGWRQRVEVAAGEVVMPFSGASAAERDERREVAVAGPVGRQQDQLQAAGEGEL